ncbi:glycosyltransferase family 2 protein [Parabacteroides faecis]|jgi:putative glycosyltransferase
MIQNNNRMLKISLITVTYNSERTLRDTFESVLAQSYSKLEYIVIDGNSTDNTLDIIKEYEPLFRGNMKWISEKDEGIYHAMNKGIKLASGYIVGILNSDDIFFDKTVLTNIANAFRDKNIDAVYANLEFVKANDLNTVIRTWKGCQYPLCGFKYGWHPAHPTFFVKKIIYDKYGDFDTSFNISADFELMLRFIQKYQISTYYLDKTIVKMRMGGESTSSLSKIIEGNKNVLRAFKKNKIPVSIFYPIYRLAPKVYNIIKGKLKLI